jgi:two-component system, chemotaxis family, sensor histidine kinase and response regulator WspE
MSAEDLGQFPMFDLFKLEADAQGQVLTASLLALERDANAADQLESCMRAAHSLKGAARIVGLEIGVRLAHALEDCFVAAQQGRITLGRQHIDLLLKGADLIVQIATSAEQRAGQITPDLNTRVEESLRLLPRILEGTADSAPSSAMPPAAAVAPESQPQSAAPGAAPAFVGRDNSDRVLRITAEKLNRLLGLAGESVVEARWVKPFAESLHRLKRMHNEARHSLDGLRESLPAHLLDDHMQVALAEALRASLDCERFLSQRLIELELFDRRSLNLSNRLYDEALACRMRPFADGVQAFPRVVRDLAQSLGKRVRLEVVGETTQVDRDILVRLDAPLGHLLRNAIDHGLETPAARRAAGKPEEGCLRLEARHSAGTLQIIVSDDGAGVDLDKTRAAVIARKLIDQDAAARLSESELLEFLFLPGFSMKETVTDISGRGVGLDVVQDMVRQVRGTVRISSQRGVGTRFVLQLPVTLSVVRTLLAEIGGEPYAFPLGHIIRTLKLSRDKIELLEGRQHFEFNGRRVGLVTAHEVLRIGEPPLLRDALPVIVLGEATQCYGLVVDRFLGERELVVHPLDAQLGKLKDISAAALMADGSPVLIVDAEDLLRSMDKLVAAGRPSQIRDGADAAVTRKRKRVLVVDDSLTIREVERKLLGNHGYEVEVAVDGMDGWNAVRAGRFDLVVTDIDMPRMDGIELVTLINKDVNLKSLPVMVVSYKDRDEDRRRGLEAGAAYYLTKGSFHDEKLLQAVVDLIGEADA